MSEAPLDRSDGTERTEGETERERSSGSILGRVFGSLASTCRSVGRALRNGIGTVLGPPSASGGSVPELSDRSAADRSTKPAQYALVSDGTDGDPGSNSEREASARVDLSNPGTDDAPAEETSVLPASGRGNHRSREGPDHDRPTLEAEWDGDRLTLVSPEDSEARISSDVWEDVER